MTRASLGKCKFRLSAIAPEIYLRSTRRYSLSETMSTARSSKTNHLRQGHRRRLVAANALVVPPPRRRRTRLRRPLLWHGDSLWAVGDGLLAAAFADWLDAHGARFSWARSR